MADMVEPSCKPHQGNCEQHRCRDCRTERVIHQSAAPISVADSTPPTKPSSSSCSD